MCFHRFAPAQTPNIALIGNILGSSFSTAVVGYAVAVSVAKVYAAKHDYTVDGNQVFKNTALMCLTLQLCFSPMAKLA